MALFHIYFTSIFAREIEEGQSLLVETHLPADVNVTLHLTLFQLLVIVCFKLHQRTKDVLVLVGILIPGTAKTWNTVQCIEW